MPCKIYAVMGAGKPYVAITGAESEPAFLAKEFNCGLRATPGDLEEIADRLNWALMNKEELEEMGKRGRKVAEMKFEKGKVIDQWFEVVEQFI